jgi:hypothetical protein
MAITIRQLWNDYVFTAMAHQANARGGLLANGVTAVDTRPIFTQGDTRYRVPLVNDLDTILGADDEQLVSGTDLTPVAIDGNVMYAPIVYRGESIKQDIISQTQMGTDALASLSPQIATRNLNMIQKRLLCVTTGAFASGGPLASSHVYGNGTINLGPEQVKYSQAEVMGENGGDLTTLIVHSMVEADLYKRGLITYAVPNQTANPNAYASGTIPICGGARVVVNDRLCAEKSHTVTAEADDETFTASAAHGFVAGQNVVFAGATLPTGITAGTTYYVIAAGLTATAFRVATTAAGSAVNITTDGSGTITVTGGQYYSYLARQKAFYVGIQRDLNVREHELPLSGGGTFIRLWTMFYAPTIDGISYVDTTINPANSDLETGANWTLVKPAHEVGLIRLYTALSSAVTA